MADEIPDGTTARSGPRDWRRLASEAGADYGIFKSRHDTMENPRTGRAMRRVVLETPDWINVVAITPERRIVVVRQYRFGVGAVRTEIPGGMVDAGETPEEAARRELLEETGYTAPRWTYLGCVEPNPAFQDNLCHHWLAEDARPTHAPRLDGGEDIVIDTMNPEEMTDAIATGEIRHSLVISAVCRVLDLRRVARG